MGGVDWQHWTQYQNDLNQALVTAQQETFSAGVYEKPWADIEFLDSCGLVEADPEEREELMTRYGLGPLSPLIHEVGMASLRQRLEELNAAPVLESLEHVRALNCLYTDGTASVIDMNALNDTPASGTVAPIPPDELIRLYGTDRPTRDQVEAGASFFENIKRGEGRYIITYQDGQPSEILFAGYSYD